MKRGILLTVCCLLSSVVIVRAQWTDQMYDKYTYSNYTSYAPFNQSIEETGYDADLLEAAVFYETNRQRAQFGAPILKHDHNLEVCAHNHSVDMVNRDFFSHDSPISGKYDMSDRLAQVGYSNAWCAENIAYGSIKSSYASTARYLVEDIWMNSTGHRKNILNSQYTYLGCGIAFFVKGSSVYAKATQNFIRKEGAKITSSQLARKYQPTNQSLPTPRVAPRPETEATQPQTTSRPNVDRFAEMEKRLENLQRIETTPVVTTPAEPEQRPEVVTIRKSDKPKKGEKQQREPRQTVFTRFYDYSGYYTLRYFTMGYTYSFVDQRHMVNASLMDFRLACVGFSPLCAEVSVSPWDKRVAYKPSLRIYLPVAKCFAFVPYGGVALDATYLGQYLVRNYDYDKDRDFYLSAVAGLALHLSAAQYVPMDVKVEYRHPIITPAGGGLHSQGVYIGAQLYFGSIWDKKK